MTNLTRKIKVYNRTSGGLGYEIEALRITRSWAKQGDYLNIGIDELLELKTIQGGMELLEKYILIEDEEALKLIFDDREVEPEYKYGVAEVDFLLYKATLEQFLDALDYAPQGVLELLLAGAKDKLPNTTAKISAMNEKYKININTMHELNKDTEVAEDKETAPVSKRRSAPIVKDVEKLNIEAPKYNVVKKDK